MVRSVSGGGPNPLNSKSPIVRGTDKKAGPRPPAGGPLAKADEHVIFFRVTDQRTRKPIGNKKYEIVDQDGNVFATGKTDWQGTVYKEVPDRGSFSVRFVDEEGGSEEEDEEEQEEEQEEEERDEAEEEPPEEEEETDSEDESEEDR